MSTRKKSETTSRPELLGRFRTGCDHVIEFWREAGELHAYAGGCGRCGQYIAAAARELGLASCCADPKCDGCWPDHIDTNETD